jgi:hypothetical protein
MVNGAFSAVVRHEDDTLTELKTDPVTGKITKYEKPIPNGLLYDLSLPDAGRDGGAGQGCHRRRTATNLASKASTYLARMDLDMRSRAPTILSLQAGRW